MLTGMKLLAKDGIMAGRCYGISSVYRLSDTFSLAQCSTMFAGMHEDSEDQNADHDGSGETTSSTARRRPSPFILPHPVDWHYNSSGSFF
jgi:hypothetical protein